MNNVYFYSENVCVRVYLMQNSSVGRTNRYGIFACHGPRFEPGFCPNLFWICVLLGSSFLSSAPGESPGALMNNVYFYSENVCVRVYLMQNSSVGRTNRYGIFACHGPRF